MVRSIIALTGLASGLARSLPIFSPSGPHLDGLAWILMMVQLTGSRDAWSTVRGVLIRTQARVYIIFIVLICIMGQPRNK